MRHAVPRRRGLDRARAACCEPKSKRDRKRKHAPQDVGLEDATGVRQATRRSRRSTRAQASSRSATRPSACTARSTRARRASTRSRRATARLPGLPDGRSRRAYVGEYYGLQGTTWKNPPILEGPTETRKIRGRKYELYYDGDRLRLVAWQTGKAVYWISNTLLLSLTNKQMLAIARVHASTSSAAALARLSAPVWLIASPSGSSAPAGSAWSPPPASPSSATRSGCATSCQEKIDTLVARRGADLRARPVRADHARTPSACTSRLDMGERASRTPSCCSAASTRRRPTRATPTSRASSSVVEEIGDLESHALVMKTPCRWAPAARSSAAATKHGLRLEPRVPQGGLGDRGLHAAPTASSSARAGGLGDFGDRVEALYEPLDAPMVRTDVASAEMIKLASNAFLATKISFINEIANVSEELGADVRGGGARDGPRLAHRPAVPARRARATAARASRRTSRRSSSSPATRATTSSC